MRVRTGLLLSLAMFAFSAHAATGVAVDPVTVTVVDAKSRKPLENAIVAVAYPVYIEAGRNLHEGPYYRQSGDLHIAEARTDSQGRASFPAFVADPPPAGSFLRHDVPLLLVYKAGYQPEWVSEEPRNDNYKGVMEPPREIHSRFSGKGSTVQLQPEAPDGLTPVNINQAVGFMEGNFLGIENCRWTKFPALRAVLEDAAQTRPELARKLARVTAGTQCTTAPAITWNADTNELHVDVNALADAGNHATSTPLETGGGVTIVAEGEGARGMLFFERSQSDEKYHLRFAGERAVLGPLSLQPGERVSVHFLGTDGMRTIGPQRSN